MNHNASNTIVNENKKTVLCVGMCVLDIVHVCSTFPVEDSDKRSKHGRWQRGGNASNNCTVLRQLGVQCEFLGSLTNLKMFEFVLADITSRKINYKHCPYHNAEAPLSSIILNESTGSRTIVHSNPNMPSLTYDDFKKVNLNDYGWINFEARNPEETSKMMEMVVAHNKELDVPERIMISLDIEKIQLDNLKLVNFADVVILGKDLAVHLGYENKTMAVYNFRKLTRSGNIIICPWGTDGVAALDANDTLFTADAYPADVVVDSLGAGDTFAAAIIFALYQNYSLNFAIQFASRLAGVKVTFFGYDKIGECFKNFL